MGLGQELNPWARKGITAVILNPEDLQAPEVMGLVVATQLPDVGNDIHSHMICACPS